MKIMVTSLMLLLAPMAVYSESKAPGRTTIVCTGAGVEDFAAIHQARMLAKKIFAKVGVSIDWRRTPRPCPADAIQIGLSWKTPQALKPDALAYAMPYERASIQVFYGRISNKFEKAMLPIVLAYVLVHEITHMLQRMDRHSNHGIMKAAWDAQDLLEMRSFRLAFDRDDIDYIHRGLSATAPRVRPALESEPERVDLRAALSRSADARR